MPWKMEKPMDQKIKVISYWQEDKYTVTELSEIFGISRKTIYKYIDRYNKEGIYGLEEKRRTPLTNPNMKSEKIKAMVFEEKLKHTRWGPKKLVVLLKNKYPNENWPVPSTAGDWLKRVGLVNLRKRRNRVPVYGEPFINCTNPNDVWSIDYKGQYQTKDKRICYPLTITDNFSRYLISCEALPGPRYLDTYNCLKKMFREYGLPFAIRSDNGVPFASASISGLSRLSIWWIKLGIIPERIEPGEPQQNGRHERMHRTLKEYIIDNPAENIIEQQIKFDYFKKEYNFDRPHESLNQQTPSKVYVNSFRKYPNKLPKIEYNSINKIRIVRTNGEFRYDGDKYYISHLLCGEPIELKELDNDKLQISYGFYPVGLLDLRKKKILRYEKVLPMSPV